MRFSDCSSDVCSSDLGGRGTVSRFGCDEFIILCRQTSREGAAEIAEDILAYFREPFDIADHHLIVTASMGIAVAPQDGRDRDEILQHADMALYQAKHGGRNRYSLFERSEERRVGKKCGSTCRFRWSQSP